MELYGYDILESQGQKEGIRYAWRFPGSSYYLESASFINKTKGIISDVSGYTTSVSLGCILRHFNLACKFCKTGRLIPFSRLLTAKEIALQNVFMVLADMHCSDHFALGNCREFAYMGQGEPGYSYSQLRIAIKLTNYIMKQLKQPVFRHIVATSGVTDMIPALVKDLETQYFDSRVTIHFSLHSTVYRDKLMPINLVYPYEEIIKKLEYFYLIAQEKPCIGVLLFENFSPKKEGYKITTNEYNFNDLLSKLDPKIFRLSLCEYNASLDLGESDVKSEVESKQLLSIAIKKGFEAKLFSSFGKEQNTACGNLGGGKPSCFIGKKWKDLDSYAIKLVEDSYSQIIR